MSQRNWNWQLWAGFLLCLLAFPSYLFFFAKFPVTRDFPWANFLMIAAGLVLLASGLVRAFRQPAQYRGRIAGPILGVFGLALGGLFAFFVFHASKQLPPSAGAPRVGQKAPEFTLPDTSHQPVSLASLLAQALPGTQTPPKGVLLIFYRGYW